MHLLAVHQAIRRTYGTLDMALADPATPVVINEQGSGRLSKDGVKTITPHMIAYSALQVIDITISSIISSLLPGSIHAYLRFLAQARQFAYCLQQDHEPLRARRQLVKKTTRIPS
jgi:hypothetical protein